MLNLFKGKAVVIRTVTFHYMGRLEDYDASFLQLSDASWLADSRRWSDFLRDGPSPQAEIEAYPDGVVLIPRGPITDICEWRHPLPRSSQ
jgi:hypothetical protein